MTFIQDIIAWFKGTERTLTDIWDDLDNYLITPAEAAAEIRGKITEMFKDIDELKLIADGAHKIIAEAEASINEAEHDLNTIKKEYGL